MIEPDLRGDVEVSRYLVVGVEDAWRNQPLGGNFFGILAECHVGEVEEPAQREIIGVAPQSLEKHSHGVSRARLYGVHAQSADGHEAGIH